MILCVDGPLKGSILPDEPYWRVPQLLEGGILTDVLYTRRKVAIQLRWEGSVFLATAHVASVNKEFDIIPNDLTWDWREMPERFEDNFLGWFSYAKAIHAPWTLEAFYRERTREEFFERVFDMYPTRIKVKN